MKLTRRKFLFASGITVSALTVGFVLRDKPPIPGTVEGAFQPNAWLQITADGQYIFQLDKSEMGQGVMTTLPTILAEELDLYPARLQVEMAGVHDAFNNTKMGVQITGGSTSTPTAWDPLREAGATTRAWLLAAAAKFFSTGVSQLTTDNGTVHWGEKKVAYHELLEQVKTVSPPSGVKLKDHSQYRWIGNHLPRRDSLAKTNGEAMFGIDTYLDGMLTAVVVRCPHFGGSVANWDKDSIKDIKGVKHAFPIHSGIAIVAEGYWPARKAANVLTVSWDKGPLAGLDSEKIKQQQQQASNNEGFNIVDEGEFAEVLKAAENNPQQKIIEASYASPMAHHSPMEPQNCVAVINGNKAEVWAPTQTQDIAQSVFAHYSGLERENIKINTTLLGGGFGRRGYVDFVGEVAAIAKEIPGVPVKVQWSREDDMHHDYYRPPTWHEMKAVVDENGLPVAWNHNYVSPTVLTGFGTELISTMLPNWVPLDIARGIGLKVEGLVAEYDVSTGEGAKIPYAIKNKSVNYIHHDTGVPVGFWRSVAHSHNAFVVESFIDELAVAAEMDPVEYRRKLLTDKSDERQRRYSEVMELVVKESHWGHEKKVQGIAVHESFLSFVAMVVDITVSDDQKNFTVDKVYCAVDCGQVINPAIVRAQIQGGAVYGLTAALKDPVTIEDGKVKQSNFHDLPVLRMNECPEFKVKFVETHAKPGGVGEIGTPPIAPAVANAIYRATGKRLREMPFRL